MFYLIFIIKNDFVFAEKSNYFAEDGLTGWAAAFGRIKQGQLSNANEFTSAIFSHNHTKIVRKYLLLDFSTMRWNAKNRLR